jgi:hypothetical protein
MAWWWSTCLGMRGSARDDGHDGVSARWARRLSWREVAETFQVSWEAVYRSVEWFVAWGLAHRQLKGVESIGVDEIHWGRGLRAINS